MMTRITLRTALVVALAAAFAGGALAQYSGGGMGAGGTATGGVYTPPKGGYKSSTGIAIGAGVAAGAALAYFALRNRGAATGCVESAGNHTALVMGNNNKSYALDAAGLSLKPGDKVKLKGKRSASGSGEMTFTATKLVKDYGPCESQAAMNQSPTAP